MIIYIIGFILPFYIFSYIVESKNNINPKYDWIIRATTAIVCIASAISLFVSSIIFIGKIGEFIVTNLNK